jgi:4,5-dihydroxyphthalate decarboxylase
VEAVSLAHHSRISGKAVKELGFFMALKLSMTCGLYDRSLPLVEGRVKPRDIGLDIHVNSDDRSRQRDAREGKFDVAEFFTGIYMADLEQRTLGLTAIPIFVKRMFRHSYVYVNKRAGIREPKDLNGRRVGLQTWFTTTALWARGILEEEYSVNLRSITWVANWQEKVGRWEPPSWLKLEIAPQGVKLHELLIAGEIDAGITTETWAPFGHPEIDFLLPNYAAEERKYFKKTGFFPIQHTLVVKTAVLEQHPWVALSLFDAWQQSKAESYRWLERQRVHMTGLWYRSLWEEERAVAGADPYVWGFKKSRAEVDKMLEYALRQGLVSRRFQPEAMFHPSTLET